MCRAPAGAALPLMDDSTSAIINSHCCGGARARLASQLLIYYFEPASLQQDETVNHPPWGFRVPVLKWPQPQP